jgi:hypothetical protein
LSFIAPDPVGLRCNTIFRAHGLYADFLGLFESLKPLFRRMVLFRLDSSGLVAPLPVSLVADVILGADGFNASLFALREYCKLFFFGKTPLIRRDILKYLRLPYPPKTGIDGPRNPDFVAVGVVVLAVEIDGVS